MRKTTILIALAALMAAAPADAKKKKKVEVEIPEDVEEQVVAEASPQRLFGYLHVDDTWYLQVPESLLDRPFLANTRFVSTPQDSDKHGGELVSSHVLYWQKEGSNLQLRRKEYKVLASDSTNIARAVEASNNDPILYRLPIENDELEVSEDDEVGDVNASASGEPLYNVKIQDLLTNEGSIFNSDLGSRGFFESEYMDSDLSYIDTIMSYPQNTDIISVCTFGSSSESDANFVKKLLKSGNSLAVGLTTYKTRTSFVMLPETPMRKRFFDPRVGYFTKEYKEYTDDQQEVEERKIAVRWRLEPRPEDVERYLQGELVEPQKPIVFYVDPATPEKWQPYIIAGVNDWNKAFEAAGWKNAIRGEAWPNDSTMSLEDARYTVIRYLASDTENAEGPNVNDPRSGEVMESHVVWHHNLLKQLRMWYSMQAGAVDPRGLSLNLDDELMGRMVRYALSHEIGHALGLRHNFVASSAVPVEELRDAKLLHERGFCPSIMDYARCNYVAQPEDNVDPLDLIPRIGDYDIWAIRWGYTYFPETMTDDEVKAKLAQMTTTAVNDRRLWWFEEGSYPLDPRLNIEDLGDDAMLAGEYGIQNLKRIIKTLDQWADKEDDSHKSLTEIYGNLVQQYVYYVFHVGEHIYGYYTNERNRFVKGEDIYEMFDAQMQRRAMQWLDRHVLTEPKWLLDEPYIKRLSVLPRKELDLIVDHVLDKLICDNAFSSITAFAENPGCYQPQDYAKDLTDILFRELRTGEPLNNWRRYIQREAISKLIAVEKSCAGEEGEVSLFSLLLSSGSVSIGDKQDAHPFVLAMLEDIEQRLKVIKTTDAATRAHYKDLANKIKRHLNVGK